MKTGFQSYPKPATPAELLAQRFDGEETVLRREVATRDWVAWERRGWVVVEPRVLRLTEEGRRALR